MRQILFTIGPVHIYSYGLMIAIGIYAAYSITVYRVKEMGITADTILDLTFACAIGGILGAKLLYLITILPQIIEDPSIFLKSITDGFVVYGGIILGILSGYLFSRIRKLPFMPLFDKVMPAIALAQGFGRIGCFMAGCCYGVHTDSPFHVVFPEGSLAPSGVPLVPTQLLSSGLNFLHCAFLIWFAARHKKADGQVAFLYLMCYSVGRFVLEFFRGDEARGTVGVLSTSQFISLFLFAAGVLGFAIVTALGRKKTAEAPVKEE